MDLRRAVTEMTGWPSGYGRFVFDEVGSTLDVSRDLISTEPTPFWVLAHKQTASRGRRGRAWIMPEGNFAATLVLGTAEAPAQIALRSFVMSLALYRAFVEITGRADRGRGRLGRLPLTRTTGLDPFRERNLRSRRPSNTGSPEGSWAAHESGSDAWSPF